MNILKGEIEGISVQGGLSLVHVNVGGIKLSAILIDTPETSSYLKIGHSVKVIFKETELILGKGEEIRISLQNRIPGTVKSIEKGELLSKVTLQTEVGDIASIITTNAVSQLEIQLGVEVIGMIKTNEMMLSA